MRLTDEAEIETLVAAALICLRSDDVALGTTAAERTIAVVEAADIVSTSSVHFRVALVRGRLDVATAGGELGAKLQRAKEMLSGDENGHVELLGVRDEMAAAVDALRRAQAILNTMPGLPATDATPPIDGADAAVTGAPLPSGFCEMLRGWQLWQEHAEATQIVNDQLGAAAVAKAAVAVEEVMRQIKPGGKSVELGGSWRAGLPSDAAWSCLVREMESCFWSKAGAVAALDNDSTKLTRALETYKQACERAGVPEDKDFAQKADDKLKDSLVTLTEEYMMSKLQSPDAKTSDKLRKRLVDITPKFDFQRVHATIRAEVKKHLA